MYLVYKILGKNRCRRKREGTINQLGQWFVLANVNDLTAKTHRHNILTKIRKALGIEAT